MEFLTSPLSGIRIIKCPVYYDDRGYFLESFNRKQWEEAGLPYEFVQDNQSLSNKGVIRGLHFQRKPHAQGKLVRVSSGKAIDVMLDLRSDSPTFGKHFSIELDAKSGVMVWIPAGFAHGFEALEDNTVFNYKVTAYYDSKSEAGIRFDDPELNINWMTRNPLVSQKDKLLPTLREWLSASGSDRL